MYSHRTGGEKAIITIDIRFGSYAPKCDRENGYNHSPGDVKITFSSKIHCSGLKFKDHVILAHDITDSFTAYKLYHTFRIKSRNRCSSDEKPGRQR